MDRRVELIDVVEQAKNKFDADTLSLRSWRAGGILRRHGPNSSWPSYGWPWSRAGTT